MVSNERLARITLQTAFDTGDPRIASLAAVHPVSILNMLLTEREIDGTYTDIAARVRAVDPERLLDQADRLGIRYVIPGDDEWPDQLDALEDTAPVQDRGGMPLGLWVKGPLRLDWLLERSVAIVGSRSATTYGIEMAAQIAAEVARQGVAVVSGAAFGIDQAAHRGAIAAGGKTVAVLACGVDRAYPAAHKNLLDRLAAEHVVVSECAPGQSPTRSRFLARNRIIAGLTPATVVVEAAVRSGALNTANWAGRLKVPLMAVPGPVTSAASQGCHQLIRAGNATLVTSGQEVLELMGFTSSSAYDPYGNQKHRYYEEN